MKPAVTAKNVPTMNTSHTFAYVSTIPPAPPIWPSVLVACILYALEFLFKAKPKQEQEQEDEDEEEDEDEQEQEDEEDEEEEQEEEEEEEQEQEEQPSTPIAKAKTKYPPKRPVREVTKLQRVIAFYTETKRRNPAAYYEPRKRRKIECQCNLVK